MNHFDHAAEWMTFSGGRRRPAQPAVSPCGKPLHRIAQVMQEEGVDVRAAASRMNVPSSLVKIESQATCDLKLSDLYRWQQALNVPAADLLQEPAEGLSPRVALRGRLLKAMKTVKSIQVRVDDEDLQALAMTLICQLTDIMPELTHVPAWPVQGSPRTSHEMGAVVDKQLPHDFFEQPYDM